MAEDARIQDVKALLNSINADDVAEDAAFQAQIDALSTSNSVLVAERDAALATNVLLTTERDALLLEKTATIADLIAVRDQLASGMNLLEARIAAIEA